MPCPKGCFLISLVLVSCAFSVSAQEPLDVSKCYLQLLEAHRDTASFGKLEAVFLSTINEHNYPQFRPAANLVLPGIAGGDYQDFSTRRIQYFTSLQLQLDYYQAVALSSTLLDKDDLESMKA